MDKRTLRIVAVATALVMLCSCSAFRGADPDTSPTPSVSATAPEPPPGVGVPRTEPVDRAPYFGIEAGPENADRYGAYRSLRLARYDAVIDLDDATIDAVAADRYTPDDLATSGRIAADFLVTWVIDSPLVFDDSAEAQRAFWLGTDRFFMQTAPFHDFFDSRSDEREFALVDDDRTEWRQADGYGPAPYPEDAPRVRIRDVSLTRIGLRDDDVPGPRYTFSVAYARPVVTDEGDARWENVNAHYTISVGQRPDGRPAISGLSFNGHTEIGHYVDGGWRGLPIASQVAPWDGTRVDDGWGVSYPLFDGWSGVSDMGEAESRGIDISDAEVPHAVPAYYRGAGEDAENLPYLVTRLDPPHDDPHVGIADAAINAADLPGEWFWPVAAQGGRVPLKGATYAVVRLKPADEGGRFDLVVIDIRDMLGWLHQAEYYVEAGTGEAALGRIIDGLALDPVRMALAEYRGVSPSPSPER